MNGAGGHVLVVDDEVRVREVLSEYLAGLGYAVASVGSGGAALDVLAREQPDLVLLDIDMPGLDGVETLRRIRELDGRVAVIMITANEDLGIARRTLELGAVDYVAKPFDFPYLNRAVAAALAQAATPACGDEPPGETADDPWTPLARAVFRATRVMDDAAHASTGARLEDAALRAARAAAAGRPADAAGHLAELALLLTLAADRSDLPGADRSPIEVALEAARRALPPAG